MLCLLSQALKVKAAGLMASKAAPGAAGEEAAVLTEGSGEGSEDVTGAIAATPAVVVVEAPASPADKPAAPADGKVRISHVTHACKGMTCYEFHVLHVKALEYSMVSHTQIHAHS